MNRREMFKFVAAIAGGDGMVLAGAVALVALRITEARLALAKETDVVKTT